MGTLVHAARLKPGQDLKLAIQELANHHNIRAGWVVTCVGSLTTVKLRFANQTNFYSRTGFFEIISLSGTASSNGCHLHLCVSDEDGVVQGGHLLDGCIIYTTAELIVGESPQLIFRREDDGTTGWKELQIEHI